MPQLDIVPYLSIMCPVFLLLITIYYVLSFYVLPILIRNIYIGLRFNDLNKNLHIITYDVLTYIVINKHFVTVCKTFILFTLSLRALFINNSLFLANLNFNKKFSLSLYSHILFYVKTL